MFGVPERRLRDCRDSSYFLRYAKNYTSQGGEDGILEHLFALVGTNNIPYCVDIGAWDGQHLSNSYMLTHEKKWAGLLVEANSERHAALSSLYKDRSDVQCLDCLVDIDGEHSLLNLLQQNNVPKYLDFISIDVDGADYHLWHSIGKEYQARVVCIEFNPTIPNHIYYVQDRDITIQEGSSLLALVELGRLFGYHIVVTTTFNAIFLRNDLVSLLPEGIFTYLPIPGALHTTTTTLPTTTTGTTSSFNLDNNTAVDTISSTHNSIHRTVDLYSLHQCSMSSDLFQTYSGELKICGIKKLLWHRIPMNIQQMQVIKPKKDRIFPFAPPYHKIIHNLELYTTKITTLLTSIILYHTDTTTTTTSNYMNDIIYELDRNLMELLKECSTIYGVCINKSDSSNPGIHIEKRPLQYIAQEILLNIILMCIITLQYYNTNNINNNNSSSSNGNNNSHSNSIIIEKLLSFLLICSEFCENIAENIIENKNNKRKKTDNNEYKLWLERAIYIIIYINNLWNNNSAYNSIYSNILKNKNLEEVIRRISGKLSSHSLVTVSSHLPWNTLLTNKNTTQCLISGSDTGTGNTNTTTSSTTNNNNVINGNNTICNTTNHNTTATSYNTTAATPNTTTASTEDIDELLRGLYWLHNFNVHSNTDTTDSGAGNSSTSKEVSKLKSKWKNKFHWYENTATSATSNTAAANKYHYVNSMNESFNSMDAQRSSSSISDLQNNATVNNSATAGTTSTTNIINGFAVLLKSCWSKDRYYSSTSTTISGSSSSDELYDTSDQIHSTTAALLLRNVELEKTLYIQQYNTISYIGVSFLIGGIVGSVITTYARSVTNSK